MAGSLLVPGLVLALGALLVGCGGARGGDRSGGKDEPGGDARMDPAVSDGAGAHVVVIHMTDDFRFVPDHPEVAPGDTVVWINDGSLPHTSTDRPGTAGVGAHNVLPAGAEPWDSGLLKPGQSYRRVFTREGEYAYLCVLHETAGMVGRLRVR